MTLDTVRVQPTKPGQTDVRSTAGYLVADRRGRVVGNVDLPMYGDVPDLPDVLAVKAGLFSRHRRLVPAAAIEEVDRRSRVIGLHVDREGLQRFRDA
jgi:hypothetical protein